MKMKNTMSLVLALALTIGLLHNIAEGKRVACVGNSDTYGYGLARHDAYPAQLERILQRYDKRWEVGNFGRNGATVLRLGDLPYVSQGVYQQALAYEPNIVVFEFAGNAARPPNRGYIQEHYANDYTNLIDAFCSLDSRPEIWLCQPLDKIRPDWATHAQIIRDEIMPIIAQVAMEKDLPVTDFYDVFKDAHHLYQSDGIHPTVEGSRVMAEMVAAAILGFRFLPDFNGDGKINIEDLIMLIEHWGQDEPLLDVAPAPFGDGTVDVQDLEVLMSYWRQEPNDPTLVARWALDEIDGTTAHNSVDGNDDFVVGGALWQPDGGVIGGALELDGVDDCLMATFGPNLTEGPFSVVAWIKGGAPGQVIFSQSVLADWLAIDASTGTLMSELKSTDGLVVPLLSETAITDGQWHRIALVWDGSRRMLFIDGVTVAEDMQDGLEGSAGGLFVGVGKNYTPSSFFSGLIDEIRIYIRAVKP
jgi:lysophospholipase L1-like esterase